jgi:hypothetical protein
MSDVPPALVRRMILRRDVKGGRKMADISREQLTEVVTRVMGDVINEVERSERAFGVAELRTSVADLAKAGGEGAWTISYSTSSTSIEQLRGTAQIGGESAWTISYSTSSGLAEEAITKNKAR